MDTKRICPVCSKPLAANAPEGLCPECLLKAGLGTGADIGPDTGAKTPRFTPPKIEELAAKFPQLEILEFIGQGGMGAVYKARQKQLDRVVALKILPSQAGGTAFAERFMREARALARLNHPHIVTLYEFGQSDGLFYFLMEFVDGVNLRQLLGHSRISPREALAIVPQICEALQFAHDSGIVHRDIKPENILLDKKGQVKIADFGVAKMIAESLTEAAAKTAPAAGELTEAGSTLGTPQYMAPEQIKSSSEVDNRADIYSLGVVFYQMLTGELPSAKIEPPSRKVQIDVRLDEVVLRALEKKPELRFQQASDVKTAVETIAATPQTASPETPPGFKHYKDPKGDFEVDIPEGWSAFPPTPRRFGMVAVIALLAILLGAIAIFPFVRSVRPKLQNELSEAAFLQKFDSNQIAQATITLPSVSGGAATIAGKLIEMDANGNMVERNGRPVEENFVVPNVVLTPAMEDKLLPSKNISVNIPNPIVSDIGYQLLFFVAFGVLVFVIVFILVTYFFVRRTRGPPVIPGPNGGANIEPLHNFRILRAIFVTGFAIQAIWNFVPDIRLVGTTLNLWLNLGGTYRLVSYVDLIHACFGLGPVGWGWGILNSLWFIAPYVFIVMAILYPRRWVFIIGALFLGCTFLFSVLGPGNSEIQLPLIQTAFRSIGGVMILAGFWVKPPIGGIVAEPAEKAAGRLSTAGMIGLLAIVLTAIVAFGSVKTMPPAAQTELSEENFLNRFDSNQIVEATIYKSTLPGGAATITGKFIGIDTNGNIVKQNGQRAEESFIAPTVILTPVLETNLLASKNISIGKTPYSGDASVQKPFPTFSGIAGLVMFILVPTALSVLFIIIFAVLLIYSFARDFSLHKTR